MLHGTSSHGDNYTGLLENCTAISVCDRTLVTDESRTCAAHRREKAYSWDHYVYESWVSDGGCWLDDHEQDRDDENEGGGMAEDSGTMAEFSATKSGEETGSEEENLSTYNFLNVHGEKSESEEQEVFDQNPATEYTHDLKISATDEPVNPSATPTLAVSGFGHGDESGKFRHRSARPQDIPPGAPVSATGDHPPPGDGGRISPGEITAKDYIEIERGYGTGPCDCCGYRWVNYQVQMTRERMKESFRANRKICKKCFQIAKEAETAPIRALPELLNISRMERVFKDLGRCQICNGGKVVWSDPEDHVNIWICIITTMPGRQRRGGTTRSEDTEGRLPFCD